MSKIALSIVLLLSLLVSSNLANIVHGQNGNITLTNEQVNEVEKDPQSIIGKCSSRISSKLDAGKLCDGFLDYLLKKCERLDNLPGYCEGLTSFKNERFNQISCISNPPYPNDSKRIKYCLNYMAFNSSYSKMPAIVSLNDTVFLARGILGIGYSVFNPNAVTMKLINISVNVINQGKVVASFIVDQTNSTCIYCSDDIEPVSTNLIVPVLNINQSIAAWNGSKLYLKLVGNYTYTLDNSSKLTSNRFNFNFTTDEES